MSTTLGSRLIFASHQPQSGNAKQTAPQSTKSQTEDNSPGDQVEIHKPTETQDISEPSQAPVEPTEECDTYFSFPAVPEWSDYDPASPPQTSLPVTPRSQLSPKASQVLEPTKKKTEKQPITMWDLPNLVRDTLTRWLFSQKTCLQESEQNNDN